MFNIFEIFELKKRIVTQTLQAKWPHFILDSVNSLKFLGLDRRASLFYIWWYFDYHFLIKPLWVGEGRRPWATTNSPSVPHISFFLFRQPWATTISPSVPPHLTLPGKTTFLNDIFRAFKVWFIKIQPRHSKKHNSNHFFNST